MDYEKRYKEALERAKGQLDGAKVFDYNNEPIAHDIRTTVYNIFPELKESKDEKIRKAIHIYLDWLDGRKDYAPKGEYSIRDMIAWLEKQGETFTKRDVDNAYLKGISDCKHEMEKQSEQTIEIPFGAKDSELQEAIYHIPNGYHAEINSNEVAIKKGEQNPTEWHIKDEQNLNSCLGYIPDEFLRRWLKDVIHAKYDKPTDKVEPKFKVEDWVIIYELVILICDIRNDVYYTMYEDGEYRVHNTNVLDREARLWTIEDAKDGDVLCTYECDEPKIVFILKGTPKKHRALSYHCYYNLRYPYFESDSATGCLAPNREDVKPATKEQRDTLFTRMREAGYEWDEDKKELIKL